MIEFDHLSSDLPYEIFKKKYDQAIKEKQQNIEAISISSFNKEINEVDSRYVNLKFIKNDRFIFFSNYESPKAFAFKMCGRFGNLMEFGQCSFSSRIHLDKSRGSTKT